MGLLFLCLSYAFFYHVGRVLMSLVVVQPVGDGSLVRWCFASTLALSLSLFSAVLIDLARASFFDDASPPPSVGVAVTDVASDLTETHFQTLQRYLRVQPREFTTVLFFLLSTVLLACPGVITLSVFRSLFSGYGKRGHATTGTSRRTPSQHHRCRSGSRRSSSAAGSTAAHGGSGSRRGSGGLGARGGSAFSDSFPLSSPPSRRRWWCPCGLRFLLVLLLLSACAATGYWAIQQGWFDREAVRDRAAATARRLYGQLRTRTAVFHVPREIQSKKPRQLETDGAADPTAKFAAEGATAAEATPAEAPPVVVDWTFGLGHHGPSFSLSAAVGAVTSRIAVVGVAMIGLLGGYAAITTPCLFLAPHRYWRGREGDLRKAQHNFNKKMCYVLNNYGAAQRRIASLQYGVLHEEWSSPVFSGGAGPSPSTHMSTNHSGEGYPTNNVSEMPLQSAAAVEQTPLNLDDPTFAISANDHQSPQHSDRSASSSSAVNWLQRKLKSAASVVVGGVSGYPSRDPLASSGLSVSSPAISRQRAVARIQKLRSESEGARYLSLSLYLQLHEVENMLKEAQRGGTWVGRWYYGLGIVMALYSTMKIALTAASLWYFKASTQDPVTRAVTLLEDAFILQRRDFLSASPSFSVTAIQVSTHFILGVALLLNGWMVVSSIRGVLLALFYVTMSFSGSAISRPETVAAGLSMLVGVYFIGQLVLLRSSLPEANEWMRDAAATIGFSAATAEAQASSTTSNVLLRVLGTLPYYYYQRLNDWCFLVGCAGAVVVRRFVLRDTISAVVYTASGGEER